MMSEGSCDTEYKAKYTKMEIVIIFHNITVFTVILIK